MYKSTTDFQEKICPKLLNLYTSIYGSCLISNFQQFCTLFITSYNTKIMYFTIFQWINGSVSFLMPGRHPTYPSPCRTDKIVKYWHC